MRNYGVLAAISVLLAACATVLGLDDVTYGPRDASADRIHRGHEVHFDDVVCDLE